MTTIEITRGINGYPKGLHKVEAFDSVEELNESILNGNTDFGIYRQRDGWDFWEFRGLIDKAFDMSAVLSEEEKNIIYVGKDYSIEDIKDALEEYMPYDEYEDKDAHENWKQNLAKNIFDERNDLLNKYGVLYDVFEIEYLNDKYRDAWEGSVVKYHDDVWTYIIAK